MILGVWDGHDAGACIVENGRVTVASNEERFTRRKLEPLFPFESINFCLQEAGIKPANIENVACCTSDFSLTFGRLFPKIKDNYWYVRERLVKEKFSDINRFLLNKTGEMRSNIALKGLSKLFVRKELKKAGFTHNYHLEIVEHHQAHAASAYYTSGFKNALCITLDGLGDGLSSTINICENGEIKRIAANLTRDSLGLFFQEITSLLGMRILEDECKVMALSDYAKPIKNNPMLGLFELNGIGLKSKLSPIKRYYFLKKVLKNTGRAEFCFMAQKTLEHFATNLFKNAIEQTGLKNVIWNGGIASNIKMNMRIRNSSGLKDWFVFPHMGDGGLAVGAALHISNKLYGTKPYKLADVYLGPSFKEDYIKECLKEYKNHLRYENINDIEKYAADLICDNKIVFWFQDRMEFGPRALGNRSILAPPNNIKLKAELNKIIKRREWYQPFCPSLLEEDSHKLFGDFGRYDKFMTMGYPINERYAKDMAAVIGKDKSSRPQMVGNENRKYKELLKVVKKQSGYSAVLNTSFNIHGYPIVCSPEDAIKTFLSCKDVKLVMGNFLIERK